jgi:hypothetical protein
MSTELTNKDYISILQFYKMRIPKSKRLLKRQAEDIMSSKLCKCIKKLDPVHESKSIGICTRTIVNNKGFKRGQFKCKTKRTIVLSKKKTIKNK